MASNFIKSLVATKTTYKSQHVDIPPDFLQGPSDQPITLTPVPFAAAGIPEYEGCLAVTLENVLSKEECQQLIRMAEESAINEPEDTENDSPWRPAKIAVGPGYEKAIPGYRESDRIIWDNQDIPDRVWARCAQADGLEHMLASVEEEVSKWSNPKQKGAWHFSRVNNRMRFLRYSKGNFFKPHRDSPYWYTEGDKEFMTHYTLHLYLNDSAAASSDSDLAGGATAFLSPDGKRRIDVNPKVGSVLIFQHSRLLHEGATVTQGQKFTVRMDILYELIRQATAAGSKEPK
ncbi:hypothetical protein B0I35DRAFT_469352 [Stachybotrys elegans]|uniref:Prolyl 4-hydroxylase alpha subunit domain-containing protein n=1 Tax=Stachybotrys elegans TaxID=80388 RepID=A0A8K0SQ50_9HYPO|nr:hypothetical protein B0I35DRAFT_469352 [Stachybotrys elegans]